MGRRFGPASASRMSDIAANIGPRGGHVVMDHAPARAAPRARSVRGRPSAGRAKITPKTDTAASNDPSPNGSSHGIADERTLAAGTRSRATSTSRARCQAP